MMEGGIKKFSLKTFNCIKKNCRENNTKALAISKSLKFMTDWRTDTNFIAPLRMHFKRSKSTLDSLKRLCISLPHISSTDKEVSGHYLKSSNNP